MSEGDLAAEANRWLRYAQEDLATAEELLRSDTAAPRQACWLAQQAAEKALKAALTAYNVQFPRVHDLDALRTLLPDDSPTKKGHPDLAELTEWAVEARYPGESADATKDDARRAASEARSVVGAVLAELLRRRSP